MVRGLLLRAAPRVVCVRRGVPWRLHLGRTARSRLRAERARDAREHRGDASLRRRRGRRDRRHVLVLPARALLLGRGARRGSSGSTRSSTSPSGSASGPRHSSWPSGSGERRRSASRLRGSSSYRLCAVGGAFLTQPRRVERVTGRRGSVVRRVLAVAIAALSWVRAVPRDPAGWKMLAATVLYWAGGVACLWAALRSVGVGLPLPELLLAFAAGHAAMILPLPLGGVGGVDAALTYCADRRRRAARPRARRGRRLSALRVLGADDSGARRAPRSCGAPAQQLARLEASPSLR